MTDYYDDDLDAPEIHLGASAERDMDNLTNRVAALEAWRAEVLDQGRKTDDDVVYWRSKALAGEQARTAAIKRAAADGDALRAQAAEIDRLQAEIDRLTELVGWMAEPGSRAVSSGREAA